MSSKISGALRCDTASPPNRHRHDTSPIGRAREQERNEGDDSLRDEQNRRMSLTRDHATLDLRTSTGEVVGRLIVRVLPGSANASPAPLEESPDHAPAHASDGDVLERVRLLEGFEYGYALEGVTLPANGADLLEPRELFSTDVASGMHGRLKTGNRTGRLPITLRIPQKHDATAWVEVRSRKLTYLTDYRHMLTDIANTATEVIMERFAPTLQRFEPDASTDSRTLYQRFAFVQTLIRDDTFQAAVHRVLHRPHHAWRTLHVERRAAAAVPAGAQLQRQLSRPGPRVRTPHLPVESVPERFSVPTHVETVDTFENRFVKFVLLAFRDVTAHIGEALERLGGGAPIKRGRAEVAALLDTLDAWLSHGLFREIGRLEHLPLNSQVLQKKAGYRDILRAWLHLECAARLSWTGGDSVYSAGQRDVATLYEYWVFMQLARIVAHRCGTPLDISSLITSTESALSLTLERGKTCVLRNRIAHHGRRIAIDLHYNKTFRHHESAEGSWTRQMRPDISVHIAPENAEGYWVHFDAKYRVDTIGELFGPVAEDGDTPTEMLRNAKRTDLLKMHAYRDAIRRSSGAYVIYPGDNAEAMPRYHEVLPGIGAFPLRPSANGDANGASALTAFLDEMLTHAANQTSQHERGRHWEKRVYGLPPITLGAQQHRLAFLESPPADTSVLIAYVKSPEHLHWIERHGLYNLRATPPKRLARSSSAEAERSRRGQVTATAPMLSAPFVLLYGADVDVQLYRVVGDVETWSRADMAAAGYPAPGGPLYHCLPLERMAGEVEARLTAAALDRCREQLGAPKGGPVCLTWSGLIEALEAVDEAAPG